MTFVATTKQNDLLLALARTGEFESVYEFAKAVGRPYNRVRDNLNLLRDAGKIELHRQKRNNRQSIVIRLVQEPNVRRVRSQPQLSYNRVWSSPITGVSDDVFIAGVVAEPTFDDLAICCLHYGIPRVRDIYLAMLRDNELRPFVPEYVGRALGNIEIGFARAA